MPEFLASAAALASVGAEIGADAAAIGAEAVTVAAAGSADATAALGIGAAASSFSLSGTLVSVATSTALSYVVGLLTQKKPLDPGQAQVTVRQGLPARFVIMGRQKTAGTMFFYDSTPAGLFCIGKVMACHQIDSYESHWLFDYEITLSSGEHGNPEGVPNGRGGWTSHIVVETHPGDASQAASDLLLGAWGGVGIWTSAHQLKGLAYAVAAYQDDNVKDGTFASIYPNGAPEYKAVIRGRLVFDPRDPDQSITDEATWEYSDNAALLLAWYLMHADGWGLGAAVIDPANLAAEADVCDVLLPTPDGGTEPRWRVWGRYSLDEQRKAVLNDLLAACAGRLSAQSDGTLKITVGRYIAPTVTLGDDDILSLESFVDGPEAVERVAIVNARILYEQQNWQDIDVPPWLAPARGLSSDQNILDLSLRFCPSPYQAQRIAKKVADEKNAGWRGNIRTKLSGLRAYDQWTVRLALTEMPQLAQADFEVLNISLDITSMTLLISVREMSRGVFDWPVGSGTLIGPTASTAQTTFPVSVPATVTAAANVDHSITIAWTNPDATIVSNQVQYRPHAAPGPAGWIENDPAAGALSATTPPLTASALYDIQVRGVGTAGSVSVWVPVYGVTA